MSFKSVALAAAGSNPLRVDLFYAPFLYEGIHARIPQLITSWTKTDGDLPPGAWVAEEPNVAHNFVYELKMPIPAAVDRCGVKTTYGFHRALEKAVFKSLVKSAVNSFPPFTRVKVECVCDSSTCPRRCKDWYKYPLPDYPDPEPFVTDKMNLNGLQLHTGLGIGIVILCSINFNFLSKSTKVFPVSSVAVSFTPFGSTAELKLFY